MSDKITLTVAELGELLKTDIWPSAVESVGRNGYEVGRKNLIRGIYRKLAEQREAVAAKAGKPAK